MISLANIMIYEYEWKSRAANDKNVIRIDHHGQFIEIIDKNNVVTRKLTKCQISIGVIPARK